MQRTIALIAFAGVVVAGIAALAVWGWESSGGPVVSIHGYLALVLGAFFTFALTAGLMALVFYSSRHGFDDGAGAPEDIDERTG